MHLISCNNEMPYLNRLRPAPATLDIRAESIGRRGIEQLIWRLDNANVQERIRKMVEPDAGGAVMMIVLAIAAKHHQLLPHYRYDNYGLEAVIFDKLICDNKL